MLKKIFLLILKGELLFWGMMLVFACMVYLIGSIF